MDFNPKRIAYHEAGHALLAFNVKFADDLSVVVYSSAQMNLAGLTRYLRDKFQNLLMDSKRGYALLAIAFGGCVGEELYCQDEGIPFDSCQYGSADSQLIQAIIIEMNLSEAEAIYAREEAEEFARSFIKARQHQVRSIAELLLRRLDRPCYFADLAEILLNGRNTP